jgi:hypothetical protein
MTKDERKYYDKLARLGCSLCRHLEYGETPAEIHHLRRYGGKRSLAEVIPLCPEHHRGNTGLHGLGRKGFENKYGIDEDFLLKQTKGLIYFA